MEKRGSVGKNLSFDSQSGKSLVEMILVLVIVVIVATFAVAQYRASRSQFDRQNVARQLKVGFERARFDSVKRRTSDVAGQARVIVNQSWFSVVTDINGTGTIDPNDGEVTNFSNLNVTITGQDMVFPVTLTYDQRGNVEATGSDGTAVSPIFYVCNGICTPATVTPSNSNIVLVSPAGTVNLLAGNAPLPNFAAPTVTSVPGGTDIKSSVLISPTPTGTAGPSPTASASPGATASPTPSSTPTATPTATPTPTPTATPTGTATPTPTATPVATTPTPTPTPTICASGQKPSLTGCWCQAPMTVKTNGKCT